jgi:hypothetical protein
MIIAKRAHHHVRQPLSMMHHSTVVIFCYARRSMRSTPK